MKQERKEVFDFQSHTSKFPKTHTHDENSVKEEAGDVGHEEALITVANCEVDRTNYTKGL